MAEFIEREYVLSEIDKAFKLFEKHDNILRLFSDVRSCAIYSKAADVVPVVRCKDCKHWGIREGNDPTKSYYCDIDGMWCKPCRLPHDFCSYGERKEGADNG